MDLLEKSIECLIKLLTLFARNRKEKLKRVIDYIDECMKHMQTIQDNNNIEQIEYARKWLQQAHQDIFDIVGIIVSASECDIIRNSMVSARVLHHAIQYGKVDDERIKFDYGERFTRYTKGSYDQQRFRQNSNEVILRKLVIDGFVLNEDSRKFILDSVKDVCKEDIVRISILKEKIKTRLTYVIS